MRKNIVERLLFCLRRYLSGRSRLRGGEWRPQGAEDYSDATIEHERLIKEIKEAKECSYKKEYGEAAELSFKARLLEFELENFYGEHPEFDPRNERWSDDFQSIGGDRELRRQDDWLRRSTWTTFEAVNLLNACRAERPASLFAAYELGILRYLEVDLHVLIHPVNPNEPRESFRFIPSEFVTWYDSLQLSMVPGPLESLSKFDGPYYYSDDTEREDNNHKVWRREREKEHKEAIRYAMGRWPKECIGSRDKMTGDAIADVVDNHSVEIQKHVNFTKASLGKRKIADLARKVLKDEIAE